MAGHIEGNGSNHCNNTLDELSAATEVTWTSTLPFQLRAPVMLNGFGEATFENIKYPPESMVTVPSMTAFTVKV